jgi:hypothetical protein
MTNKANLPAMAIIGASFSQLPNIFKGVFLYFWPFLLMFFLKDYYLISSIKNGLGQVGLIVTLLTIVITLCIAALQVCWYQKVITKEEFKYSFDKRIFITLGYSFLYLLFIGLSITGLTILLGSMSKSGNLSSDFAITLTIIGYLLCFSLAFRFILIFPAIAVNNPNTRIKRSWELTSGYHIKLFFMIIGFVILVSIPGGIANFVMQKIGIGSTFNFLVIMFFLNTLSLASILMITEMVSRLFVFFHVPDKINDYL